MCESWTPLINGCVNCAFFNAVSNVYLHGWKEWLMQQRKYCNNVIITSASGRKMDKQIKTHETDATWMIWKYYSHYRVQRLSWRPLDVSQGSAATYLRWGDSYNSTSHRIFLLNLTVRKYENWSTSNVEALMHIMNFTIKPCCEVPALQFFCSSYTPPREMTQQSNFPWSSN